MQYGVFLTRAQPVTLAHIACIRQMLVESDKALVIIGSANKSGTLRNPFPIKLRLELMQEAIAEEFLGQLHRIKIMPLDDLDYENSQTNPLWGEYLYDAIVAKIGNAHFAYYTGEPLEQSTNWFGNRLGSEITPRLLNLQHLPHDINATNIRNALAQNDIDFVVLRCPRTVMLHYYILLEIYLRVLEDPQEDFSTLQ